MPWDLQGRWVPEDDSVVTRLNGLLASDSPYITTARAAGERTASRRGLLNTSIAAGAAESAAIAAGAPLASQDAQQTASKNQAVLEGGINLDNTTKVNAQQNAQALTMLDREAGYTTARDRGLYTQQKEMLTSEAGFMAERERLAREGATATQLREFDQRTREQTANLSSGERTAALSADTNILQTQITTNASVSSNYLTALSNLAQNKDIPADARNAYITEFQRILAQSQSLIGVTRSIPLTWNGGTPTAPQAQPTPQPVQPEPVFAPPIMNEAQPPYLDPSLVAAAPQPALSPINLPQPYTPSLLYPDEEELIRLRIARGGTAPYSRQHDNAL